MITMITAQPSRIVAIFESLIMCPRPNLSSWLGKAAPSCN